MWRRYSWLILRVLFSQSQHGFRGGKSTLTAVLDFCQLIYESFEETESVLLTLREFIVEGIQLLFPQRSPRQNSALWGGWRDLRHVNLILRKERTNGVHLSCFIWDSGVDAWSPTRLHYGASLLFTVLINDLGQHLNSVLIADDITLISSAGISLSYWLEEKTNERECQDVLLEKWPSIQWG